MLSHLRAGVLVAVFVMVVALGCVEEDAPPADGTSDNGVTSNTSRIGSQAVYDRIARLTSCPALQSEFDIAMDNVERYPGGDDRRDIPFAYARAANNRMKEIGCFG